MINKSIFNASICIFGDATNIHLRRWALGLKHYGLNVNVISYRKAILPNINVIDISCSHMRRKSRFGKLIRLFRGFNMLILLHYALKMLKPDIVHIHYLINTPLVFGFIGIRKLVVSPWGNDIIHDIGYEPFLVKIYKKFLLKKAKEITATTHFLAKYIKFYSNKASTVIPFGVETNLFKAKKLRVNDRITLSFIKHLEEKYGPRYLLEALVIITKQYKNLHVNIVGSGTQELFLKDKVKEYGLEDIVHFWGKLNHDDVIKMLEATDIFVMPSVYKSEVFGVAAIEASAMGIPVIASDLEGIREAVKDKVTGILVPPKDANAIAEACITLIKDKVLRITMGNAGREYVRQSYEWRDCLDKMVEVYENILGMK